MPIRIDEHTYYHEKEVGDLLKELERERENVSKLSRNVMLYEQEVRKLEIQIENLKAGND
jgi:hypothetical protein